MKVLKRDKLAANVTVVPGDSLQLTYRETWVDAKGQIASREQVVLEQVIDKSATYDEGVIFEDDGELFGKRALGGAFLEQEP